MEWKEEKTKHTRIIESKSDWHREHREFCCFCLVFLLLLITWCCVGVFNVVYVHNFFSDHIQSSSFSSRGIFITQMTLPVPHIRLSIFINATTKPTLLQSNAFNGIIEKCEIIWMKNCRKTKQTICAVLFCVPLWNCYVVPNLKTKTVRIARKNERKVRE